MGLEARVGRRGAGAAQRDLWRSGVIPLIAVGTLSGLVGLYWDIAWHIDKGRDTFFTPPHNFLYLAILITLAVSVWGLWRDRRASALHLPVGRLRLHPGILVVAVGAALELFFAPADDLWHRLFGADVTLWAPMHLIGLLGLALLAFGGLVTTAVELRLAPPPERRRFARLAVLFGAALLSWLMVFTAEFEFNVPVFPMAWHPALVAALPTLALVLMARYAPVRFAATLTAVGFTLFRLLLAGGLMLTAGADLAGQSRPMIEALLLVGLAADLLVLRRAPLWLTGLVCGAVALASNLLLVLPSDVNWHPRALLVGVPLGLLASVAAAYLAAAVARALDGRRGPAAAA